MSTRVIEIKDAGAQLADLVDSAVRGSDIVLTRNNIPLARIVSAGSRTFGLHRDQVWICIVTRRMHGLFGDQY